MGKFKKVYKRFCENDFKGSFSFGVVYVRGMILAAAVLLLLYSLVFHNFIIIMVILMLTLALAATFI